MQTHDDRDSPTSRFLQELFAKSETMARLEERAKTEAKHATITAGVDGEPELDRREAHGVGIVRRPEDPDCLRISLGEVAHDGPRYLVFRAQRVGDVIKLLERALLAMRRAYRDDG